MALEDKLRRLGALAARAGVLVELSAIRKHRANIGFALQQRTTPAIASTLTRGYASETKAQPTEVSSILEQRIRGVQEDTGLAETGRVLTVGYEGTIQQPVCRNMALTD
jgi:hypothetical protein